jgi:hypothetical protein
VSLVIPHNNYGNVVSSTVDSASQKRLNVRNMFLIIGVSLAIHLMIHLLTFLLKVLHIKHSCYLFTLFHFASSAHTRNLIVTPHRSLTENSLPHLIKNEGAFRHFVGLYMIFTFCGIGFFFILGFTEL